MKIFLTGGTGFIGRHVVSALQSRGHDVVCLQRKPASSGIRAIQGDIDHLADNPTHLRQLLLNERPNAVIHLAWSWATNTHRNVDEHYTKNLRFTQQLVDVLASDLKGTHFIGAGSQAEYGVANVVLTPELAGKPFSAYGKAKKLAGEYALARLNKRAGWLRILTSYGPEDDPNKFIPYLVKCFTTGTQAVMSPGMQEWDFLHVKDTAQAFAVAAEMSVAGCHVLASHEVRSLKDVAGQLHQLAHKAGHSSPAPHIGGRPYNPNELFLLSGDSSSFRRMAGWQPQIPLDQGFRGLFKTGSPP